MELDTAVVRDSPERVESGLAVETTGGVLLENWTVVTDACTGPFACDGFNTVEGEGLARPENVAASVTDEAVIRRSVSPWRRWAIVGGGLATLLSVGLVVRHLVVDITAAHAIEALIGNRAFQSLSSRVQLMFKDVRPRILPELVRERYAAAKTAFENGQYDTATDEFEQVLALLNDRDLANGTDDSSLADLRTLATGFLDLATAAGATGPETAGVDASTVVSDAGTLAPTKSNRLRKGRPNSHTRAEQR